MSHEKQVDRPPLSELKGVRYVGDSDIRVITARDFKTAGVADVKEDLEWKPENEHFIAVGQMNAAAVDFLATQEDFELV